MKSIPNILSVVRIFLSIILFFLKPLSYLFLITYFICGFSDVMDGYIARKTSSVSNLGSRLDSVADIIFMSAAVVTILPTISIPIQVWIWIALIAFIRIISMLLAYSKYHEFAILHTYANKATGFILFCIPILYKFIGINILEYVICAIASVSSIEELIIHITSKELKRDIISIFLKNI